MERSCWSNYIKEKKLDKFADEQVHQNLENETGPLGSDYAIVLSIIFLNT